MAEPDRVQQAGPAGTGRPRETPHPGLFQGITSREDAARLYMTLERSRDASGRPGGPAWELSEVRGELLARLRVLYDLDPYRRAPAPDQVVREAVMWRAAAARTGLRDIDFDPAVTGAGGWERDHLRAAAVFVLAGDYREAGAELGLAATVAAPGSDAQALAGRLRARLGEAAAGLSDGDPSTTRMTGISTQQLRQELRTRWFDPKTITELTGTALNAADGRASASDVGSYHTVVVAAAGDGRWDLRISPHGANPGTPGTAGATAPLTAGEALPVINRQTGEYAFVTGRQPHGGTVEVRNPDRSPGQVAASSLVPAVTVLDTGLRTAMELARDLGIAPPSGPGRLPYGSPYTAWYAIARANGVHAGMPAVEAAEAAASRATGLGDPANANGAPRDSVPWARAACQALAAELSSPGAGGSPAGPVALGFPPRPAWLKPAPSPDGTGPAPPRQQRPRAGSSPGTGPATTRGPR